MSPHTAALARLLRDEKEAIIDITGVPTVDTLVGQHLVKAVTAIRLMGADCIIIGIRPQIAQTIVHLGIDLQGISTKATLADALSQALRQTGPACLRGYAAVRPVAVPARLPQHEAQWLLCSAESGPAAALPRLLRWF